MSEYYLAVEKYKHLEGELFTYNSPFSLREVLVLATKERAIQESNLYIFKLQDSKKIKIAEKIKTGRWKKFKDKL